MQAEDIKRIVKETLKELGLEGSDLIKISELEDLICCDQRTIYRMMEDSDFPRPIKMRNKKSPNRWFKSEVLEWLKTRNRS